MYQTSYTQNLYSNSGLLLEHQLGSFRPGDILMIWYKGVRHYGVYVGGGLVIDNSKRDGGVTKVSIETFRAGRDVKNLGHTGPLSRSEVVNRAFAQIGQKWSLISSNCESFYRSCQGRSEVSFQVLAGAVMAGCLVVSLSRR